MTEILEIRIYLFFSENAAQKLSPVTAAKSDPTPEKTKTSSTTSPPPSFTTSATPKTSAPSRYIIITFW